MKKHHSKNTILSYFVRFINYIYETLLPMFHYCYISANPSLDMESHPVNTAGKSSTRVHDAYEENQTGAKPKQTKQKYENMQSQVSSQKNDVRKSSRMEEDELSSSVRSLSKDQHQPTKSLDGSSSGIFLRFLYSGKT